MIPTVQDVQERFAQVRRLAMPEVRADLVASLDELLEGELGELIQELTDGPCSAHDLEQLLRAGFEAAGRPHVQVVLSVSGVVRVFHDDPDVGLYAELTWGTFQPMDADGNEGEPETGWHVTEPPGIDVRAVAWVGAEGPDVAEDIPDEAPGWGALDTTTDEER